MDTTSQTTPTKTILIIEDEKALLTLLTDKMISVGIHVNQATNGEEGLRKALQTHPDLILLDIVMPEMNGMILMRKLRENEWGKTVPIILLTNVDPDDNILNGVIRDQPAYYMIKSDVQFEEIIEKIKDILKIT